MNTQQFTPSEIKTNFATFIGRVEAGDEIIVNRNGQQIEKIEVVEEPKKLRAVGWLEGKITIPDDWDEWPEEEARALGIID